MAINFIRLNPVLRRRGISKSLHYREVQEGLFTRPVKVGDRASAWPDDEVDILNAAKIAGLSKSEMRALVSRLHEKRKRALEAENE